jgi:transcriptional regulator with XRE-family HTH domain
MRGNQRHGVARRVGVCIRSARRASALSRNQVARSAGLTGRELARYEHGKSIPCPRDIQALAGACGIDAHELIPQELMELLPEATPDTEAPDFSAGA